MTDILVYDVISDVKAHIGEKAWKKLRVETQTEIITSEICYSSFKKDGCFDFSSAIVPAMKGLELELRRVFYEPYLDFLASNYTPDQYVKINGVKSIRETRGLLNKEIKYCSLTEQPFIFSRF